MSKIVPITLCTLLFASSTISAAPAKSPAQSKPTSAQAAKPKAQASELMSGWQEQWPDGTPTGAAAAMSAGKLTLTGNSQNSYGSTYQRVNVDLNKTRYLVVNVDSVNGFWYIIAKNQGMKDGYVKIQTDTQLTGKQIYDLKGITNLDGKRDFEIEIGVSSGKQEPNTGKNVVISNVALTAKDPEALPGALSQSGWKTQWPDKKPTGAVIKEDANGFTVSGNSKDLSYGSVYRIVSVNLDKTPTFRITPSKVNGVWFVEASGGALKAPVKIQPDTDSAETKTYDLKTLLGLSGMHDFELHLGVGSGGQSANAGKEVVFSNDIGFISEAGQTQ